MPDQFLNRDELDGCIRIYKVNTSLLLYLVCVLAILLSTVTVGATGWGLRDGGFGDVSRTTRVILYLILGAAFLTLFYLLSAYGTRLAQTWRFQAWKRNRYAYLNLTKYHLVFLDHVAVPWQAIHDIKWCATHGAKSGRSSCLLFKVSKDALADGRRDLQKAGLFTIPSYAIGVARQMESAQAATRYLCVETSPNDRLTVTSESLFAAAKSYLDAFHHGNQDLQGADVPRFKPESRVFEECMVEIRKPETGAGVGMIAIQVRMLRYPLTMLIASTTFAVSSVKNEIATLRWPAVAATVTVSAEGSRCADKEKTWPDVRYRYVAYDEVHTGTKLDEEDLKLAVKFFIHYGKGRGISVNSSRPENACRSRSETAAILADYPAGSKVSAYYDPSYPAISLLRAPYITSGTIGIGLAVLAEYGMLLIYVYTLYRTWLGRVR